MKVQNSKFKIQSLNPKVKNIFRGEHLPSERFIFEVIKEAWRASSLRVNNNPKNSFQIGLLLFLIFSFHLSVKEVFAQSFSVGVYPPIIQMDAKPPANIRMPITLENFSSEAINLKIELRQFDPSPKENGEIIFRDRPDPSHSRIFSHVQIRDRDVRKNEIILSPKQKKDYNLTINIPKDEEPKDYYFSILFISKHEDSRDKTRSTSQGGIATNVLLSLGDKRQPQGKILNFSAPKLVTRGPVPLLLRVQNNSPHFITADGRIVVSNLFGQNIGKVDILPVNIIAKNSRLLSDIEGSEMFFESPRIMWKENFLLGFYTAEASVALSDQGPVLKETTRFLAIPIEIIGGVIISILIIILIYKRLKLKQKAIGL